MKRDSHPVEDDHPAPVNGTRSAPYATILVIDDDPGMLRMASDSLEPLGYRVHGVSDQLSALRIAEMYPIVLAVIGEGTEGNDSLTMMDRLRRVQPQLVVIVLADQGTIERAVDVMKHGACHYLAKPVDGAQLAARVERCLRSAGSSSVTLPRTITKAVPPSCARIIAHSDVMKSVLAKITQVAQTDANVYIEGESGTGKELIARCLHGAGRRAAGLFVAINCAAIPENLLESELLGYEKGAFTGAVGRRVGLFAQASGGSFFFDELAELPLAMQAKLLRILEEREFYPLGSSKKVAVDVRIIAASNRRLEQLIREGQFREDLYYRVRVIPITLPPLRERREDILPLAYHFLQRFSSAAGKQVIDIADDAAGRLIAADWPGNVRELENVMEYAVAVAGGATITADLLDEMFPAGSKVKPLRHEKERFERDYLVRLLEQHRGNISRAAREAGKHRADLYALLRRHELSIESFRSG